MLRIYSAEILDIPREVGLEGEEFLGAEGESASGEAFPEGLFGLMPCN